jgi:hypothetical protein
LAAVAALALAEMVTQEPGLWFMVGPRVWAHDSQLALWSSMLHLRRLLEPIEYWPIIFLIVHAIRKRKLRAAVV